MARPGSTSPGPYQGGYWVVSNGKDAYLVDKTNLPPTGKGWTYYWVGSQTGKNQGPAGTFWASLVDGASALGASIPTDYGDQGPQPANKLLEQIGSYTSRNGAIRLKLPHESAGNIIGELVGSPLAGIAGVSVAAGVGEGTLAGATGAAKAVGAVAGADALSGLFGGLSNWEDLAIRVLQALAGFALLLLGLQALTGTGGQGMPLRTIKRYK